MQYEYDIAFEEYMRIFYDQFSECEYVVWGTEKKAVQVRAVIQNVKFYVDNNSEKWGRYIDNVEIGPPELLKADSNSNVRIVVAVSDYNRIYKQLDSMGISEQRYCNYRELIVVYEYMRFNRMVVPQVALIMNNKCSLNCRGCIEYIPYIKEKENFPRNQLLDSIDALFDYVDYCGIVIVGGGEPLLHGNVCDVIECLYDNYMKKGRIGRIWMMTNGTIIPSAEVLECLAKCKVLVNISDYREAIGNRSKLSEILTEFNASGVDYYVEKHFSRYEEGLWYDMGNPNVYLHRNEIELREVFSKCTLQCWAVWDSKFYNCNGVRSSMASLKRKGTANDFCDLTRDSKGKFLKYYLGYCDRGYYDFCNYCNGFGDVLNNMTMMAGEQM